MTEVNKVRKCHTKLLKPWSTYLLQVVIQSYLLWKATVMMAMIFQLKKNVVDGESESEPDTTDTENSEKKVDATKEKPNNDTIPSSDASTSKDKRSSSNKNEHEFRWRSKDPSIINYTFYGDTFSPPPERFDEMLPIDFLKISSTDNVTNMIAQQKNLYSVQKKEAL